MNNTATNKKGTLDKRNREKRSLEQAMQDDQWNSSETLLGHLFPDHPVPGDDDLTLLTLKGHLIIEDLLNTILARLLRISSFPTDPEKGGLGFYQKVTLVEMFVVQNYESGPNADLFSAIKQLNRVRNKLAHTLKKPIEVEEQIKELLKSYCTMKGNKPVQETDLSQPLKTCLLGLWRFLFQVRLHFFKMEKERLAQP